MNDDDDDNNNADNDDDDNENKIDRRNPLFSHPILISTPNRLYRATEPKCKLMCSWHADQESRDCPQKIGADRPVFVICKLDQWYHGALPMQRTAEVNTIEYHPYEPVRLGYVRMYGTARHYIPASPTGGTAGIKN